MPRARVAVIAVGLVLAASLLIVGLAPRVSTLGDLQRAFAAEENTEKSYLAFADRAESEGRFRAARLFRAVAEAERIHALRHGTLVNQMGDIPSAREVRLPVASTRENLKAAIAAESRDRDQLYPRLIRLAEQRRASAALDSLTLARRAEAQHARLFSEALAVLDSPATAVNYYVCMNCGFVSAGPQHSCPACGAAAPLMEAKR